MQAPAQVCSSVDPTASLLGHTSQLTQLTQGTSPRASTTHHCPRELHSAVTTSSSLLHASLELEVPRDVPSPRVQSRLGEYVFYLAKPHLTQEGYLKGAVQAANRTSPHCGGHIPSGNIPAELSGVPSPGKLAPHSLYPPIPQADPCHIACNASGLLARW